MECVADAGDIAVRVSSGTRLVELVNIRDNVPEIVMCGTGDVARRRNGAARELVMDMDMGLLLFVCVGKYSLM